MILCKNFYKKPNSNVSIIESPIAKSCSTRQILKLFSRYVSAEWTIVHNKDTQRDREKKRCWVKSNEIIIMSGKCVLINKRDTFAIITNFIFSCHTQTHKTVILLSSLWRATSIKHLPSNEYPFFLWKNEYSSLYINIICLRWV